MADDHTDNEVPRDPKQWYSYTDQQRFTLIEQVYTTHDKLLPVFEKLESIVARTQDPETCTLFGLALLGDPGVGKTAAVQHWMKTSRLQRTIPNPEGQEPYLYISLYPFTSRCSLLAHRLAQFENPNPNRGKHA